MADDGAAGAASSSSSPAPWLWATSSLSEGGMYDVFLNFRGEDTRFLFTDYLYHGLADVKKLQVFRDDPGLKLGDAIKPTLMEAIKRSRIHIVVMSKNYVCSSWCLMELKQMVKYSKNNGNKRSIIPVFYNVKPAEVRYQISTESKEAMQKHEEREGKEKAEAWKSALSTVCNLSGEHIVEQGDHYKSGVIGKIAEQVSEKLLEIRQQINRFVSQFEVVESLLNLESCDTVGVMGIYEDPKIGKSYIRVFAFELYYKIKYKFQAAGFLVDVSKFLRKTTDNHLENLQKELLDDMDVKTMQELEYKKMLLVLEGVNSKEHLELLVGMGISDWFGGGSRILIATENRNLFEDCPAVMNGVKLEKHCIREGELVKEKIVKEKKVVGFVKEFIDVINQLKEEDSNGRNVVSIVGMGGSGKTTLARMIYDSNEVRQVFPCRAWATVSKQCIEKEVYRNLLKSLKVPKSEYEILSKVELKKKVKKCLNGQGGKYLIVLDDVWDKEAWNKLECLLPKEKNGSRILMTTRNDRVANYAMSKEPHHQLGPLDEEQSWELFRSEVFGGEECPSYLEPIGKSIAESCKGLPLAVETIAGLVKERKRSNTEWQSIKNIILKWDDDDDDDDDDGEDDDDDDYKKPMTMSRMMKILKTSYDDLRPKLKRCFLYLGVFPEDCKIAARELIELWNAEGLTKVIEDGTSNASQPEDLGEERLKMLVDRNLVQVVSRKSDGEGVKTCRIHDLFRKLCISLNNKPDNNDNDCRLLSFPRNVGSYYACSVETCNESPTLSLFFYGDAEGWAQHISENRRVKVLYFSQWVSNSSRSVEYLESLSLTSDLKYLRMDFSDSDGLHNFPSLETLHILHDGWAIDLSIGGLKKLRHLYSQCQLNLLGVEDKMQDLQTLPCVTADSHLWSFVHGGYFPNLRKLALIFSKRYRDSSAEKNIKSLRGLSKLRELTLKFVHFSGVSLDNALPSSLTKISLSVFTNLKSKDMNTLGLMPKLQILKLTWGSCAEETLDIGSAGSFPCLEVFIMRQVRSVAYLKSGQGAMPHLRRAVFCYCPDLKEVTQRMRSLGSNLEFLNDVIDLCETFDINVTASSQKENSP
ncbi:disease resistance protein RPP13 [Arachis ipaensis]|uniref:disease resistance protein RPP13 n=1 Tax=Arachis ipaensis TaxID=130454 RepID=UPI000A2B6C67|nr:disease resistance protein RPP13 [Arachis ipaensis]